MKLGDALMQTQASLAASSDSARLDAEILIGHVLGLSRSQLRVRGDDRLSAVEAERLANLVRRRSAGEPVAYLTGMQGFWTLDLKVGPAVLVPRPETELLVEWALELHARDAAGRIADLGTGSGAIALAMAAERPHSAVDASDVSDAALAVARDNAQRAGLAVRFRQGSWWQPFVGERFDLVLSNPPYVAAGDPHLGALGHEPLIALSDGHDGLHALRAIIAGAADHLNAGSWLLVEHGYDQGEAVRQLFTDAGFASIRTRCDLESRERVTGGQWP